MQKLKRANKLNSRAEITLDLVKQLICSYLSYNFEPVHSKIFLIAYFQFKSGGFLKALKVSKQNISSAQKPALVHKNERLLIFVY